MTGNLPDLDEAISFTVDDGAQAGPFTMRTIIDSIRMGDRIPTTLVWWAGEPEWVTFSTVPELMQLLQGLPATNQPPPPGAEAAEAVEHAVVSSADEAEVGANGAGEAVVETDPIGQHEEPKVGEFRIVEDAPVEDVVAEHTPADVADAKQAAHDHAQHVDDHAEVSSESVETLSAVEPGDESGDWFDSVMGDSDDSVADVAAGGILAQGIGDEDASDEAAEVEWAPEAASIEVVESEPATFVDPEVVEVESPIEAGRTDAEQVEPQSIEHEHPVEGMDSADPGAESDAPDAGGSVSAGEAGTQQIEDIDPRMGLFGSGAGAATRDLYAVQTEPESQDESVVEGEGDDAEPEPVTPSEAVSDASDEQLDGSDADETSDPSPLESYEARLHALGTESPIVQAASSDGPVEHTDSDPHLALVEDVDEGAAAALVGVDVGDAATETAPDAESHGDTEALESHFAEMVKKSWTHHKRLEWATRLDDVLLGAIITSTLDNGFALIDLKSDGSNHFVRFEHPTDGARITMGIDHLTRTAAEGEVLGHHASVVIGWGQRVADATTVLSAVKDEVKSGMLQTHEPGTVTVEADLASGYAYTQVDLIWAIEDFVSPDYSVDHAGLSHSIASAVHSLRKYWYGRFTPAQG